MTSQSDKFKRLVKIIFNLSEVQDIDKLLRIFLDSALELVKAKYGSIYRLDYQTGEIKIIHHTPADRPKIKNNAWGEGILSIALKKYQIVNVDDTLSARWKDIYIPDWKNMRSEIAVPIFLENIPVRIKTEIKKTGRKRIGILSIESKDTNAFSKEQEDLLFDLARYVAIRIENLESDRKLNELRKKEKEIADSNKDYNQIIDLVINGIINILGFDIVNISLVSLEKGVIETRYAKGALFGGKEEQFKKQARHSLDSKDIQADIIRTKKIDVPEKDDERLDKKIAQDFQHEKLVRVFMPMIESANAQAIGTVECGYDKTYREFIYERDVQILESFVNHAVQGLEKRKKNWLEVITHELKNPIVGIRNHADKMLRSRHNLREDQIEAKLEDIIADCSILFNQVRQLEFMLGATTSFNLRIESVSVSNEIIKVFQQLKPEIRAKKFSIDGIEYQFDDRIKRLKINTDRARFNQIIYNLMVNSIKYAEEDPNKFKIRIKIDDNDLEKLRIRFQDYGVGIREDEKDRIFHQGYRGVDVKHKKQGSGMGLSVSRDLVTRLGGELLLITTKNPTEFQIVIPYKLNNSDTISKSNQG
jgi:signal transduction histidine kinase/putative methionine-R-sulfoxide reductase with GAF domain